MSEQEKYIPTPEDYKVAEEIMTEEQKRESDERAAAFAESRPNQLNTKIGTLLHPIAEKLLHLHALEDTASKNGFVRKPEFHITVIGYKNGKVVMNRLNALPPEEQHAVIEKINDAAKLVDWSIDPGDVLHIQKEYVVKDADGIETSRERRESLIQQLDVPGMNAFYERMNQLLGTELEPQPPHITLYSTSTDPKNVSRGIGIDTMAEWEELHPQPVKY